MTATGGYLTKTSGGGWHGLKTPFARDDAVWDFDMKAVEIPFFFISLTWQVAVLIQKDIPFIFKHHIPI